DIMHMQTYREIIPFPSHTRVQEYTHTQTHTHTESVLASETRDNVLTLPQT
ncbi:unnamed protein product, partial [Candidula unifasciata]